MKNKLKWQRPMHYDINGKPYKDVSDWARDFEKLTKEKKRHIGSTYLFRRFVWVSTVWLGLDQNFLFAGKPLIFESMTFCRFPTFKSYGCTSYQQMVRYSTKEEAAKGHEAMVRNQSLGEYLKHLLWEHWK